MITSSYPVNAPKPVRWFWIVQLILVSLKLAQIN
jgi:hypothetical protein